MTTVQSARSGGDPNLFTLHGDHLAVTLALTGSAGKPQLTYQDPHHAKSFTGDEIILEDTALGRLATVTLLTSVDAGFTSFTLLTPVLISTAMHHPITTIGVTTLHRTTLGAVGQGQLTSYHVSQLTGTAQHVE